MPLIHQDRNGCALHGALRLFSAIHGVAPITHANAGCTLGATSPDQSSATHGGWLERASTTLLERHVVFGGTSRLREQIKNTVKVLDADLYAVVTGCVPEIVGDDVPAMVKEAREQQFPVIGISTPGFKGNAFRGYESALLALIEQLPEVPQAPSHTESGHLNLLGLVPGLDPFWESDLLSLEQALLPLGHPVKRLLGVDQSLADWHALPGARLNIVFSPWGLEAARLLQKRYQTPYLYIGHLPVGRDLGALIQEVGEELGVSAETTASLRARHDRRLRHFLHQLSASFLQNDVQKRIALVGTTAYAVGWARYLVSTLGQYVKTVVLTDEPPDTLRADIEASIRSAIPDPELHVLFASSTERIEDALRAARPELILGSAEEAPSARSLGIPLLEVSFPLQRPTLLRSYVGLEGAVALASELGAAFSPHTRVLSPGQADRSAGKIVPITPSSPVRGLASAS